MKVLFSVNIPSPYRVDFFNELGKLCDLTVLYERRASSERDSKWVADAAEHFEAVFLDMTPVEPDLSRGSALRKYVARAEFDALIFTNYVSPATMEAIAYCKLKRIPYYMVYDGGFFKKDRLLLRLIKQFLLCSAKGHLTTCEEHRKYLQSLGISPARIEKYPFTSVRRREVLSAGEVTPETRRGYRQQLRIPEEKVILAVGQFIHRKGFDVLLEAVRGLDQSIGIYIVGGEPTEEYLAYASRENLTNVHFVGFCTKQELKTYYLAADVFAMPTREDIWGLVVNEALACGLPVVSTDRCISALELLADDTGVIVKSEDPEAFRRALCSVLENDHLAQHYRQRGLQKMQQYTIEEMAQKNIDILTRMLMLR